MSSQLDSLPCLPTVFEFLPLIEVTSMGLVNRHWNLVASVCPMTVIDTVGMSISTERLIDLIRANKRHLVSLKVSAIEVDQLVDLLIPLMQSLTRLEHLSIFSANADGAVRFDLGTLSAIEKHSPIKRSRTCGLKSLVLGCEVSGSSIEKLLYQVSPQLTTLAFLRGCDSLFKTDEELIEFLNTKCTLSQMVCLHLGHCPGSVDMDPVIALLLAEADRLRYIHWSNAGAGLDMMKALMTHNGPIHCAFEGSNFLSFLFRITTNS